MTVIYGYTKALTIGLATFVVVRVGTPSLVEKVNDGVAVSADCQNDEKVDSARVTLVVDLRATTGHRQGIL